MQVVFDPAVISYDELLQVFWRIHDPGAEPYLNQYRNAIFYLSEAQHRAAEASRKRLAAHTGRPVRTAIEPAGTFTPAEDYHQKYYLQQDRALFTALQRRYPDRQQLFRSTAAARLNGFFGCNGESAGLGEELRRLDLPADLTDKIVDHLKARCRAFKEIGCALPLSP